MKPKAIYLALCILGGVLPYWQFLPWLFEHGLNVTLLVRELFASRISSFFGIDVIVSAVAALAFMRVESARLKIANRWVPAAAVLLVGVSFGLPMFLYIREKRLQQV
jgi:hypothetical protein